MKKHWKAGSVILVLVFAIAVFSISVASKDDKPISNASPEIAQARQRRVPKALRKKIRNNPELREKLIRQFRSEKTQENAPKPSDDGIRPLQKPVDRPAKMEETLVPDRQNQNDNEADYYKVIVAQNLFRPLGSGAEKKGPSFGLLGTVIAKSEGEVDRALIMNYQSNRSAYVAEGEKIGEATVEEIESRSVKLLHKGEMVNFSIQSVQFIGAKGGGGGRGGPSIGRSAPATRRSGGRNREQQARMKAERMKRGSREKMAAQFREKMEYMKKEGYSPEEIKKVAIEFKESMGKRGGTDRNLRAK